MGCSETVSDCVEGGEACSVAAVAGGAALEALASAVATLLVCFEAVLALSVVSEAAREREEGCET